MKIYVCWSTTPKYLNHEHPCGIAHQALVEAGHDPEVVKAYGWTVLPDFLNNTAGRKRAEELTGSNQVPVLELDDGTAVGGSKAIVNWARKHPA